MSCVLMILQLFRNNNQYNFWCTKEENCKPKNIILSLEYGGDSIMLPGCLDAGGSGEQNRWNHKERISCENEEVTSQIMS